MTPKERLIATLKGEKVDRPPVSFYEIGGFVLMPSASPYGREISELTLRNYQIIIEEINKFRTTDLRGF